MEIATDVGPLLRCVTLAESSQVGEARRAVQAACAAAGMDATSCSKAALIATELGNNIVLHSRGGEILFQCSSRNGRPTFEIWAVDRGPGMSDPEACLSDGYSTRGTSGTGLGAIQRQATEFDLYSTPEGGSVVWARLSAARPTDTTHVGGFCLPYPGETVCGDSWCIKHRENGFALMLCDGLGHGVAASDAAAAAVESFANAPLRTPAEALSAINDRLRGTRGGTVAVADFDRGRRSLLYAGIGNIAGHLISAGKSRGLVSLNGTVGAHLGQIQQFAYDCDAGLLVMHSDGIRTRWDLAAYPGLQTRHPSVISGVVNRDFSRGRDDASLAVVRWG
jgi:anti-sigma regulatory factor (Ser/Thr protein kinase)